MCSVLLYAFVNYGKHKGIYHKQSPGFSQYFTVDTQRLLAILEGLHALLSFYLPAAFKLGYFVRYCTWQGREPGTGDRARTVLSHSLILLLSLLNEKPDNLISFF